MHVVVMHVLSERISRIEADVKTVLRVFAEQSKVHETGGGIEFGLDVEDMRKRCEEKRSETIFHTLAALRALRAKHRSITYLLNVKIDLSNTYKMIARLLIERHTIDNDSVF